MEEFNIQCKQTSFYKYCPGTFGYTLVFLNTIMGFQHRPSDLILPFAVCLIESEAELTRNQQQFEQQLAHGNGNSGSVT